MIGYCDCANKHQDAKHGKGRRVHNSCKPKAPGQKNYRCTVCGKEKTVVE